MPGPVVHPARRPDDLPAGCSDGGPVSPQVRDFNFTENSGNCSSTNVTVRKNVLVSALFSTKSS